VIQGITPPFFGRCMPAPSCFDTSDRSRKEQDMQEEKSRHWWQCEWNNESCVHRAAEWHPAIQLVLCEWHSTVYKGVDEVMATARRLA
jgi:hypothetical protein